VLKIPPCCFMGMYFQITQMVLFPSFFSHFYLLLCCHRVDA
jgi:hypothetical protein